MLILEGEGVVNFAKSVTFEDTLHIYCAKRKKE